MEKTLQAVYKDGVLQPLEALPLEERQQVTVTITDVTTAGQDVAGYFTHEEWARLVHGKTYATTCPGIPSGR